MTDSTSNFADSPDIDASVGADALSEILDTVRLRGRAVARYAPSSIPFNIAVPGQRLLHIVERGDIRLRVSGGGPPVTLSDGDLVLLAQGDTHRLQAGVSVPVRDLVAADRYADEAELPQPDSPRWVTGTFAVDEAAADPLLSVLPAAIVVSGRGADREWLEVSLRLLVAEVAGPRAGSAVMISRILDLLFIHTLRAWSRDASAPSGWLTAALDPVLGQVLSAIHQDLGRQWSVAELAAMANLSRTAFAERFARLLGRPPAGYLADRRLDRAAYLLRTDAASVATIARDVGYASEAGFSRAFSRRYGAPPLRWKNAASRVS
ncbi:AraC family transcriptional regulator [Mycobacterium sp. CBMA293]|uniref:AraC family transcriptional regulator n=1 Tax=unclassified Mycolicibacterium TaxID=2636767 RepID=UPI0012DC7AD2|nr:MULTISPECIES: AraC family transcriptional regulator [unclassified Mycolicibacterium]MUL49572.1 AraC family transcriptional regulator [Mycolicibacterium sp. CBMA 360]MUL61668.1 AraC family transcriptional regulator [Mycolicibacterium sp. CBMA 335]MUL74404.1 AraC family transcriptional regulator [Mycolicibacterium sp. CBMA 311]MUL96681.1 AraC family transcriptional regulator [Mycolicibacterium sp. CBMA 230]MUM04158.1 AraC family transcriptional regulator [Mycolicibacterium sp. CBMA 213]